MLQLLQSLKTQILSVLTSDNAMHISAHLGMCHVITSVTQVTAHLMTSKVDKFEAVLLGILLSNALNIGRKALEDFPDDTKRAVIAGLVGSLLAGISYLL